MLLNYAQLAILGLLFLVAVIGLPGKGTVTAMLSGIALLAATEFLFTPEALRSIHEVASAIVAQSENSTVAPSEPNTFGAMILGGSLLLISITGFATVLIRSVKAAREGARRDAALVGRVMRPSPPMNPLLTGDPHRDRGCQDRRQDHATAAR